MDNLFLNEQTSEQTWQEPKHSPSPKINRVHVASPSLGRLRPPPALSKTPPPLSTWSQGGIGRISNHDHARCQFNSWQIAQWSLAERSFFAPLLLLLSPKTETNILFYHLKFIPQVPICVPVPRRATPNLHKNLLFGVHRCKWFWMSSWSLTTIK